MKRNLRIHSYESIEQVPQEAWDSLASRKCVALETDHLRAIERSGINNLTPYYLLALHESQAVGIGHCFTMKIDLSCLVSDIPPEIRTILRSWNHDFMNLNILECGLISGLGEGIAAKDGIIPSLSLAVVQEMENIGKRAGAEFMLIRDIPYYKYHLYKELESREFRPVQGFPTTVLQLEWATFEDYLAALKGSTRSDNRDLLHKLNSPEITVEIARDFAEYSNRMEYLWNQTSRRATDYEHVKLTASYFREINQQLPVRSHIIAIKRYGEIIAFTLCLLGDQEYFSAHPGIDYQYDEQYGLYFNLTLLAIQDAIGKHYQTAGFGITAYDYKFKIGCEAQPLVYLVKHIARPQLTPALVSLLRNSIKQPENVHQPLKKRDISQCARLQDIAAQLAVPPSRSDVFNKVRSYERANFARLIGLYAYFPAFESAQAPLIQHNGRPVVMLGNNSYLGLGTHPEVCAAAKSAVDKYGTGCSGSPFLNGTLGIHLDLARSLAEFVQKEDAILFSTGYQTNLGIILALVDKDDVVIMDELNHASLIDGARLAHVPVGRYKHNDMDSLRELLESFPDQAKLIVTDSIFSMEGTIINLPAIVELTERYGARLMLDEAHAIGVIGPGGRGVAEHFGLLDKVDLIMGTFSKSFAAVGGFVAGDAQVIDYLRHVARSHMFSASLPPAAVATARKALDIIIQEPERRTKTLRNAELMSRGLQELGYKAPFRQTAIVPVYCGNNLLTLGLYKKLLDEGVYVNPVLYPAVPRGEELLRTSYMATHNEEVLDRALRVFEKVRTPGFPQQVQGDTNV